MRSTLSSIIPSEFNYWFRLVVSWRKNEKVEYRFVLLYLLTEDALWWNVNEAACSLKESYKFCLFNYDVRLFIVETTDSEFCSIMYTYTEVKVVKFILLP